MLQPNIQHTVESQPNVHYLVDFEDDHVDGADQIDRFDHSYCTSYGINYDFR